MNPQAALQRCDLSTMEVHDDIAVLRFPRIPLFAAADIGQKKQILDDFERAAADRSIRTLVIAGSPEKSGRKEYGAFVHEAAETDDRFLFKMLNAFNQIILEIVKMPKPVVSVESGSVLSQFLHMTLACDYRIVAENTVFQKAYLSRNMVPKGAGAFFLRRLVGTAKAFEILTSEEDMTAGQALVLGLVHEVVSAEALEHVFMEHARKLARIPANSMAGIKRLLHYPLKDLEDYLDMENQELYRAYIRVKYP